MKKIEERIEELETMVYQSKNVLTFNEASKFIGISKSYLYKLTSAGLIPHYKPSGKMIYFEKADIMAWIRQNRVTPVKSGDDNEQEPETHSNGQEGNSSTNSWVIWQNT